ncbi:hypothetical protein [Paraburkholderia xenovorans]|uniref:hypothetical protein n=1 Tax=Paraburkholderia xenovorans TaxID=36873 RepID=UPI0015C5501E|nr:hypothetical protein [Paraburkholderia xenovorans]NPT36326.1 hypothetical protein [Paraburkholderia xenovorans]
MAIRISSNKFYERFVPGGWKPGDPSEVLTPAGHQYLRVHGVPPPHDEVRADSAATGDGLRKITHVDPETGRKLYEFQSVDGSKRWMDPWRCPLQEQVMLNKKEIPKDQFTAVEAQWRADRARREQAARDLAAGMDVRFDLETGERVR